MNTKNIARPALRLTSGSISRSFQNSGKRHLVLTGARGAGKTTLAKALLPLFPEATPVLNTRAVPGERVDIFDCQTGQCGLIGLYRDGAMQTVQTGFLEIGVPALERAIRAHADRVFVDELGFLENDCLPFRQKVSELFDKKSVIAVLRRQSTAFLDSLKNRSDVFLYDLDNPVLPVGCVVMASGMGVRFGGNKLLADFDGNPLMARILDATDGPLFAQRVVVTRRADVAKYCDARGVAAVLHDLPHRNDTIRLGLEHWSDPGKIVNGCMFAVADQPFLTHESLESMVLSFSQAQSDAAIVSLCGSAGAGNPVLFGRAHFHALCALEPGQGGQAVLRENPACLRPLCAPDRELLDIDTPSDLAHLLGILRSDC